MPGATAGAATVVPEAWEKVVKSKPGLADGDAEMEYEFVLTAIRHVFQLTNSKNWG